MVTVSSIRSAGSATGQGSSTSSREWPSCCQSASARWGIIGPMSRTKAIALAQHPGDVGLLAGELGEAVAQLMDARHGAVEAELLEILGDAVDRLVNAPAHRLGGAPELRRPRRAEGSHARAVLLDGAPQAIDIAPGTFDAFSRPL